MLSCCHLLSYIPTNAAATRALCVRVRARACVRVPPLSFSVAHTTTPYGRYRPGDIAVGERLAVMVWIHGGGMIMYGSNDHNGSTLAATNRVIVVSLNYRLGPLGFLVHRDIAARGHAHLIIQTRTSLPLFQNGATSVFEVLLSVPSTFGAGGPNQNTSRIQHKEGSPYLICSDLVICFAPFCRHGNGGANGTQHQITHYKSQWRKIWI